jgi:hypothetical protein
MKDDNGISKTIKVHRVVLNTFNFNDNYKSLEVNHKDGKKSNNNIDNLEWVTRQQNIQHCIDNNLQYVLKGEEVGNSILKEKDVIYIRQNFKPRVYTRKMLANKFSVSEATIKDILSYRSWKHLK